MKRVLIDTDIILDFYFDRKPFSDDANAILSYCELEKLKGFITPVIFSNLFYLLKKTATHKKVINQLKQLLLLVDVLTMDKKIVLHALNSSDFKDLEDGLQHYAALQDGKIEAILTRNTKDFRKSVLPVFLPSTFIKQLG